MYKHWQSESDCQADYDKQDSSSLIHFASFFQRFQSFPEIAIFVNAKPSGAILSIRLRILEKIVEKVLEGTVSLPGKYGKLTEEDVRKYREEQLTLAGLRCKIGLGVNK